VRLEARLRLQIADHTEKVLGLTIALRAEHADQAFEWRIDRFARFSSPTVALT
jgi:hypothetical protein